jgi:hypothetical protein
MGFGNDHGHDVSDETNPIRGHRAASGGLGGAWCAEGEIVDVEITRRVDPDDPGHLERRSDIHFTHQTVREG